MADGLTVERIERLGPGRALDAVVGEHLMGWIDESLDPAPPPAYSTNDELADTVLARIQPLSPADHHIEMHDARDGWHVLLIADNGEIDLQVVTPRRNLTICRFALLLRHRYPHVELPPPG
jgi:hypothetical protein